MPRPSTYECELHGLQVHVSAFVVRGLKGNHDAPAEPDQADIIQVTVPIDGLDRANLESQVLEQYHEPPDHDVREDR